MIRTNFLKAFFAVALLSVVFTACTKEDLNEMEEIEESTSKSESNFITRMGNLTLNASSISETRGSKAESCFVFSYPITIVGQDSRETEITSDENLAEFLETNYRGDVDKGDLKLLYPVEVTLENGTVESITNNDEFEKVLDSCEDDEDGMEDEDETEEDGEDDDCFAIVFPIDLMLPDGSIVTVNNEDELEEVEDSLEMEDEDSEGEGEDDEDDGEEDDDDEGDNDNDGNDNDEEGEDDEDDEGSDDDDDDGDNDDEEDDDDDGEDADEDEEYNVIFPIDVTLEDGSTVSVDSEDALEALEESCE